MHAKLDTDRGHLPEEVVLPLIDFDAFGVFTLLHYVGSNGNDLA